MQNENLLTTKQVSERLQLKIQTVQKYIRQGKLNAILFGKAYRVSEMDLMKFITEQKKE
jgi:excisionase family DNA binding protein